MFSSYILSVCKWFKVKGCKVLTRLCIWSFLKSKMLITFSLKQFTKKAFILFPFCWSSAIYGTTNKKEVFLCLTLRALKFWLSVLYLNTVFGSQHDGSKSRIFRMDFETGSYKLFYITRFSTNISERSNGKDNNLQSVMKC